MSVKEVIEKSTKRTIRSHQDQLVTFKGKTLSIKGQEKDKMDFQLLKGCGKEEEERGKFKLAEIRCQDISSG